MHIGTHLSAGDALRVQQVFEKFEQLGFTDFAVTGGLALEAALSKQGTSRSTLNDIDLVARGFAALPVTIGNGFLVRHIHPDRPQGKLMMQLVCPDNAVRVDIFSACGAVLTRALAARIGRQVVHITSLEDMVSRIASELLNLTRGETVHAKAAQDYHRLSCAIDLEKAEAAWREQRRSGDPDTFSEARFSIDAALPFAQHLLTPQTYSNIYVKCPHCRERAPFRLDNSEEIKSLIGDF